ncbi:MAG: hypothetical protein ACI4SM_03215 [Candidatus Gastranaerophilaceae bacterium]
MTREEKDLLIKDLSSRLLYGVKISIPDLFISSIKNIEVLNEIVKGDDDLYRVNDGGILIEYVKPYLRPISSMTEEEVDKLFNILNINQNNESEWLKVNDINIIRLFTQEGKDFYEIAKAMDYLYSIHIDFRGLIEKGLAIDATGKNIYQNQLR